MSGNLFWVVLWYGKLFAGYKTISWLLCSELHPTGNSLSYFYLYWKKSNFHSRPININLIWALDKKICFLHCQLTLSVLCTLAGSFTTSEEHLKGFLFHFLAPAEQTFHLSIFQWNAGTNIHTDSHALTDVHTQAGVRNMKWFSAANCEIHLNRLFSQLCDRRQYLGPDWAAHLKKKKPQGKIHS